MLIPKKYHIHLIALCAVAAILFFPNLKNKPSPEIVTKGTAAAEKFLALIDAGEYRKGWESSSKLMQEKVVLAVWSRQMPVMRDKYGDLQHRQQKEATLSDYAKDAPDGSYLTLKYDSSFTKKREATETLILALEQDGAWRVAGYFIQ